MGRQTFDASDVGENRVKGGLGYLIFFLPLVLCPGSRYGRYCANQGLLWLMTLVVLAVAFGLVRFALGWIPLVGGLINAAHWIARAAVVLIGVYDCYLACAKGDARELPVIGGINIIK